MYPITKYTFRRARQFGVQVKQSTNKTKKIDVFKHGRKIAAVGAAGMNDYPTYINTRGKHFANTRRHLYKQRHQKDRLKKGTNGYWADKLLW